MSFTEIAVIVGGLVLGYWIVAVLLPALGKQRGEGDDRHARPNDADAGDDGCDDPGKADRSDGPPVRREM